jgi:Outer membrane protein beta-barrel domain
MTRSQCFYLLLLIAFATPVLAQKNYQPAYIVNNSGDTIKGFIDYREWYVNPKQIKFKATKNGVVKDFSSLDIRAFKVVNELYVSKIVDVEFDSTANAYLWIPYDGNAIHRDSSVFLLSLVQGKSSLFLLTQPSRRASYYLQKDASKPILLVDRATLTPTFLDTIKDKSFNRYDWNWNFTANDLEKSKSGVFGIQITYLLADFPPKLSEINSLAYKSKPLSKVINAYNAHFKGSENSIIDDANFNKFKVKFGVNAAYMASYLNVSVSGSFYNDLFIMNGSGYGIGLTSQYILPRTLGKWAIFNDFVYNSYKASGQDESDINNLTISKYTFNLSNFRIYTQARYRLMQSNKLDVFINAGIFHSFLLKTDNYFEVKSADFPSSNRSGSIIGDESLRRFKFGIVAGFGINYNRHFQLECRIDRQSGLSKVGAIFSLLTNIQIMGSYFF